MSSENLLNQIKDLLILFLVEVRESNGKDTDLNQWPFDQ